jgi:hypothetical protein
MRRPTLKLKERKEINDYKIYLENYSKNGDKIMKSLSSN